MHGDEVSEEEHNTEESQIEALKAGSPAAWEEVLSKLGPRLLGYAVRMLGDKAAAEEILQDSLVNIYKTIDRFDGHCSIKSWMYRVVHNRSIDEIRRRKRYVDVTADPEQHYSNAAGRCQQDNGDWDGHISKQLDDKLMLDMVSQQINQLPHAHREVLLLKEVEGFDSKEICAALEISAGNLRIRIHRARVALRESVVQAMKGDKQWS